MKVGTLEIDILANLAKLRTSIDEATGIITAGAKRIDGVVESTKKGIAGLAAGLTIGAFAAFITNTAEAAESVYNLSLSTGATVEQLTAFAEIGRTSGTTAGAIGDMMLKLARNMAGAKEEGVGTGKALAALGINFEEFRRLSPDQQMLKLAKSMEHYADGSGKAAAIQAILGKGAAANIPFMKDLASASEFQAKMTTEQASAAADFNANMTRLKASGEAWTKELAMGMMPALKNTTEAILGIRKEIMGTTTEADKLAKSRAIAEWTQSAINGASYVVDAFQWVSRTIKTVGEYIGALMASNVQFAESFADFRDKLLSFKPWEAVDSLTSGFAKQKAIWSSLGATVNGIWSEETLGAKLRARVKDLGAVGAEAKKAKEQVDFVNREDKGGKSLAEKQAEAYKDLIAGIKEKIAAQRLEAEGGLALTEAQKLQLEINKLVEKGTISAADATSAATKALLEEVDASEKAVKQSRELAKSMADNAAATEKLYDATEKSIDKLNAEIRAQKDANAAIGLGTVELAKLERARVYDKAAALDRQAVIWDDIDLSGAMGAALRQEAARWRELADLKAEGAVKQQDFEQFKGVWESIDRTAHDVWTNIWEGGSNVFKKLGDTLKAAVLDLLYQMTIKKWIINLGVQLGVPGASAAQSALGQGGGGLGGLLSGGGAFGQGLSAGFSSLFGEAGIMGGLDAGVTAIGAGNMLGGIGTLMGTLGPIAIGIGAIIALSKQFKGETRSGGKYNMGQFVEGPSGGELGTFGVASGQMANMIDETLRALGSSSRLTNFMTGIESSERGKGFAFAGGTLNTGGAFGQGWGDSFAIQGHDNRRGDMTPEQAAAAGAEELKQAYLQAIQAAQDVPKAVMDLVEGKDIDSMATAEMDALIAQIDAMVVGVGSFRAAVAGLPPEFDNLKNLSFDAAAGLIEASGGFENLQRNLDSFYTNYFTEEERKINLTKQLASAFDSLGVAMPKTREEFRALVLAQDLATEAGQKMYAQLLGLADAFASVTATATTTVEATEAVAEAQAEYVETISQGDVALQRTALALEEATAWEESRRDAIHDEMNALRDNIRQNESYIESIKRVRKELTTGSLSQISPEDAYNKAKAEFERLSGLDANDPERLAKIAEAGRAFAEASKAYNATNEQFFMDQAKILGALEASEVAAQTDIEIAKAQLSVLEEQLATLKTSAEYLAILRKWGVIDDDPSKDLPPELGGDEGPGPGGDDNPIVIDLDPIRELLGGLNESIANLSAAVDMSQVAQGIGAVQGEVAALNGQFREYAREDLTLSRDTAEGSDDILNALLLRQVAPVPML